MEQESLRHVQSVTAAVDQELAGLLATTQVLSLSRRLQEGKLESFDEQAREVFRLLGINVVLRDRNSQQLVNTRLPRGSVLPLNVDRESDQIVLQTRKPVVSNLFVGGVTRKPLFIVNVPVMRDDEVVYFLNLSLEPERIQKTVQQESLPPGWSALVTDRRGVAVTHSRHHEPMVGQHLPNSIWSAMGGEREGLLNAADPAGNHTPMLIAFRRSHLSGWTVLVTVPAGELSAPLRLSILGLVVVGSIVVVISLWLALAFSLRIERAVGAVAAQATALGHGEQVQPLTTSVREVNMLSHTLSDASRERHLAYEALRKSEEHLRLAQAAGRVGTWEWDAASDRMTCSEAYCEIHGLDPKGPGHPTSRSWFAQVHPDDQTKLIGARDTALESGRLACEYRIIRPDGSVRWIIARGAPIFDAQGQLARFVGANVDMTEVRQGTERVRELQSELFHASRLSAMGEMAASLAHELNQPLGAATSFLGAARLALKGEGAEAPARALVRIDKAIEQTVRAGAILRRIRDFIGRRETGRETVEARQLIEDAVALALVGFKDPNLRVRFNLDPAAPTIFVDRIQVQQVVFNLVKNALEAMSASDPRELLLMSRDTADGNVEILVADSGPGLPADTESLFKPFVSSKSEGMGMGLSICRTIVEAHQGRLWAESRAGGGTVFCFTVPAAHTPRRPDA